MTGFDTTTRLTLKELLAIIKGRAAMTVYNHLGRTKERRVNALANIVLSVDFDVHNSSIVNTQRAITERVMVVESPEGFTNPPLLLSKYLVRLTNFYQAFEEHVFSLAPWKLQQFAEHYVGHKRLIYERAADSLTRKPIRIKDSYITAFVKAEKINRSRKPDPAPRIIQPRSPRYNVAVGVYIKPIEKIVYKNIAKVFGSPTVAKGMNAIEVGKLIHNKWMTFKEPIAIGLDASRFDQHCGPEILKWEHSVYRMFYPGDKHFARLLRWQLYNKGRAWCYDGRLEYSVKGCRMSGDMNTGLGNCLIMCALVWSYFRTRCHVELINNGDDCVVIMEKQHFNHMKSLPKWFKEMGYTMKVEPKVDIIEEIEFCQCKPVFDGDQYVMVRKPDAALSKDLISMKNLGTIGAWKYQCQAISDCGLAAYGNMPVYWQFYNTLNVGGRKRKGFWLPTNGLEWMSDGLKVPNREPTTECRVSFWRAFGMTPQLQVRLEEMYKNFKVEYDPGPVVKISTLYSYELFN